MREVDQASARASAANVVKIVSTVFICVGVAPLLASAITFWFTRQWPRK
jgi:hypothetical protein